MYKGIFWLAGGKLLTVKVLCDGNGAPLEAADFSAKSGENFNHRAEWARLPRSVTGGLPFDYWPRGRVEIRRGRATVFLHPSLNRESVLRLIRSAFRLDGEIPVRAVSDGSAHYHCEVDINDFH